LETEESGMSEFSNTELNAHIQRMSNAFAATADAVSRAAESIKEFGISAKLAREAMRREEILRTQMRLKLRGKNWRSAK
jgi:hypothetical protein